MMLRHIPVSAGLLLITAFSFSQSRPNPFDGHGGIGEVLHKGSAVYDPEMQSFTITGSRVNIWFNHDEFHFLWKK
jgi:hypothetical protein